LTVAVDPKERKQEETKKNTTTTTFIPSSFFLLLSIVGLCNCPSISLFSLFVFTSATTTKKPNGFLSFLLAQTPSFLKNKKKV